MVYAIEVRRHMQKEHLKMKDLPTTERPYEKLTTLGASNLSDAELLAVIIRVGTKDKHVVELMNSVLSEAGDGAGLVGLSRKSLEELMKIPGIGPVKASQLKCIMELAIRLAKQERKQKVRFNHPRSVAEYYMQEFRFKMREELLLIMLDTKGKLLKDTVISSGTINYSIVEPREVFVTAFQYHAVQIILLHNHPSGDPTPSTEDLMATKRIKEAGEIVGIELIDHIIIGDNQYVSLSERKLL